MGKQRHEVDTARRTPKKRHGRMQRHAEQYQVQRQVHTHIQRKGHGGTQTHRDRQKHLKKNNQKHREKKTGRKRRTDTVTDKRTYIQKNSASR